jgi:hypothetical protein
MIHASWLLNGSLASQLGSLSYTMKIDHESLRKHVAHIEARIPSSSFPSISFETYAWFGEVYLEIPISNVSSTDESGRPLEVSFSKSLQDWGVKRTWSVTRRSATLVIFKYDISFEYYISRIQSYAGYIGSDYALGVGAFTFLVPSNFSPNKIEVKFDLPEGWMAITPWECDKDHYVVSSIDELATATFGLGNFQVFHRVIGETNVTIATYRAWGNFAGECIANFSFTAFEYVRNLFGKSPRKKYLAVYCPPAEDGRDISGWAEGSGSQGIAVWGGWGLQEGIGWKRPFLHRVIHIWNEFPPYGMQAKTTTPDWTNWFLEGSTDYYAFDKALIHLGVLSNHRVLADFFKTYMSQYLGTRYDAPVAEAYNFVNDPERYFFLMYRKGALICFLLDSLIQRKTAGNASFDDVMRLLYEKFGNMHGIYTNRDIQKIAQQLLNEDLSAFFNNYVYGKTKLPFLLQEDDLTVDWAEFLQRVKISSITLTVTATTASSTLRTKSVSTKTSNILTTLQTTTTLETQVVASTFMKPPGVFSFQVVVIIVTAFTIVIVTLHFWRHKRYIHN